MAQEMEQDEFSLDVVEEQMGKTKEHLQSVLSGVRTGRAQPSILDSITVKTYGGNSQGPLQQFAQVSSPEPSLLNVTVFDQSTVSDIETAIRNSGLGLNPQAQGTVIRINVPKMTQEQRAALVKLCGKHGEDAKIRLRAIRQRNLKRLEGEKSFRSEDDIARDEKQVQKLIEDFSKAIDDAVAAKKVEIEDV
eukprot:TRINITY_DN2984_c0_g1_i1.p1 TRINITY_DN2984_c0_g1~~TRINITY_DN2984_c0_g1_i1.p1  ORF type:complete len:192 (-),score=72.16 TRINITY_DN2984_c0_g1_i1:237-812(-)